MRWIVNPNTTYLGGTECDREKGKEGENKLHGEDLRILLLIAGLVGLLGIEIMRSDAPAQF